mmetsp:Transcript_47727/g.85223  ORF Transcript_47727/g.85223 Transcript_47727/m.85223 type:complete len:369 (+) Transcript_47727:539-1645(+)
MVLTKDLCNCGEALVYPDALDYISTARLKVPVQDNATIIPMFDLGRLVLLHLQRFDLPLPYHLPCPHYADLQLFGLVHKPGRDMAPGHRGSRPGRRRGVQPEDLLALRHPHDSHHFHRLHDLTHPQLDAGHQVVDDVEVVHLRAMCVPELGDVEGKDLAPGPLGQRQVLLRHGADAGAEDPQGRAVAVDVVEHLLNRLERALDVGLEDDHEGGELRPLSDVHELVREAPGRLLPLLPGSEVGAIGGLGPVLPLLPLPPQLEEELLPGVLLLHQGGLLRHGVRLLLVGEGQQLRAGCGEGGLAPQQLNGCGWPSCGEGLAAVAPHAPHPVALTAGQDPVPLPEGALPDDHGDGQPLFRVHAALQHDGLR